MAGEICWLQKRRNLGNKIAPPQLTSSAGNKNILGSVSGCRGSHGATTVFLTSYQFSSFERGCEVVLQFIMKVLREYVERDHCARVGHTQTVEKHWVINLKGIFVEVTPCLLDRGCRGMTPIFWIVASVTFTSQKMTYDKLLYKRKRRCADQCTLGHQIMAPSLNINLATSLYLVKY